MLTLIISEEVKKYVGHDREGLDRDLLADFEGGEQFVEPGILPNGHPMRGHQRAQPVCHGVAAGRRGRGLIVGRGQNG
jgi:hypothetical protein